MTRGRRAALGAALLAVVLAGTGGCVYYPSVLDTGGVRIEPRRGRAVRQGEVLEFYVDIASTGRYGDVLGRVEAPVAGRAQLVGPGGGALERLEVPGESVVQLRPGGPRVVLSDLKRALAPGEVFIVTLFFDKSGALGVVTVVE